MDENFKNLKKKKKKEGRTVLKNEIISIDSLILKYYMMQVLSIKLGHWSRDLFFETNFKPLVSYSDMVLAKLYSVKQSSHYYGLSD